MSERAGRLSGMAVAVAGSTQGIGADIAKRLAAEGALVAVSGRNREKGEKVVIDAGPAHKVELTFHVIDEIEKLLGRNTVRLVPKDDIYAEFKARRRFVRQ